MTYTVAYWQETAGGHVAWIACPRENFIAAQGETKEQARESLRRTIIETMRLSAHYGQAMAVHPVPADLLHHFDGDIEHMEIDDDAGKPQAASSMAKESEKCVPHQ